MTEEELDQCAAEFALKLDPEGLEQKSRHDWASQP